MSKYEVIEDIPSLEASEAIPWFNKEGKGIQYYIDDDVQDLFD